MNCTPRRLIVPIVALSASLMVSPELRATDKVITARDREHWAFLPPKRVVVPEVKKQGWVRNPIDAFVLAQLEENELRPAPEADRPTLIRRLSFDLTGLPPTPEEVEAFVNDRRDDAYERVVDRLLESPRYGERWAH